jgi:outer membrane lipoprotein-sorting protein
MNGSRSLTAAWIVIGLVASLVLVPAVGWSADWAGVSKKLTNRCATYGKDVKDMTSEMSLDAITPKGPIKMGMKTYLKGDLFRGDIEMQDISGAEGMPASMAGMTMVVIGDGQQYWMVTSMMGKQQVPAEQAAQYGSPWRCDKYIPTDAEITGSEKVDGRDCYVVAVKDSSSEMGKVWLDKETLNPLKVEGRSDGEINMVMLFQDYRKLVGELSYPYKSEIYQGDKLVSTITVKTVEINKNIPDTLFDPDKVEVKGPTMEEMMKKMQEQQQQGEQK